MSIPKVIWLLWLQGWDEAPPIVRACAATWRTLNPGWDVRCLDRSHLDRLFETAPHMAALVQAGVPPEALSDLVRLELLDGRGGVWADATTYALQPLDDWLPAAAATGFFAFDRPGGARMISSWFLAAEPGSPVVRRWLQAAQAYWRGRRRPGTYFWIHKLFRQVYLADDEARRIWDATPRISADGPHALNHQDIPLLGPASAQARALVEDAAAPMLKLTHKVDHGLGAEGTFYRWLCRRALDQAGDAEPVPRLAAV